MSFGWNKNWEVRECATLGTFFADIYCDGELFAREVNRSVAEVFCKDPAMFGQTLADIPKLRTWIMEREFELFSKYGKV